MGSLDVPPSCPPPPPPKKMTRPKITLQIPTTPSARGPVFIGTTTPSARGPVGPRPGSVYWGHKKYHGRPPPITPASQISDPHGNPYFNPFDYMGYAKASDFMVKNFTDFKDFTMSTAKSGLSAGEKTAFWFYNQLRRLSKKWFTHFFLTICLALYSVMGAMVFMALEGYEEYDICLGKRARKVYSWTEIFMHILGETFFFLCRLTPWVVYIMLGVVFLIFQNCICFVFCS